MLLLIPDTIFAAPITIPFDTSSKKLYKHISTDLLLDLEEASDSFGSSFDIFSHYGQSDQGGPMDELRGRIMSKLTSLRMLCDHPDLIKHSGKIYRPMLGVGSKYANELLTGSLLDPVNKTPKLLVLKEYADSFLSDYSDNKLVIFTSYVGMVDILHDELVSLGYGVSKYTGKMDAKAKEASKVKFQTDPDVRILVSSDAGGYGVDLPQANLLINYDIPWNAGLALQRNGRIRRASSTWKSIVIQDLVMEGSIEERQHTMLSQKLAVANAVMDGEGINDQGGISLNVGTLKAFLQGL